MVDCVIATWARAGADTHHRLPRRRLRECTAPASCDYGRVIVLPSIVMPALESARPTRVEPWTIVMLTAATMLPRNLVVWPRVADVPTCQKTFFACAPPLRMTCELVLVVSAVPTWKTQRPLAGPASVTLPVSCADEVKQ